MAIARNPSPFGSFSESVAVSGPGRWIHVSGMIGVGADGALVDGGLAAETDATFDRMEEILARADARLADVVRITAFLTDLDEYAAFDAVRARRFADGLPASAAVRVAGLLLGAAVEIDAVAFVPDAR